MPKTRKKYRKRKKKSRPSTKKKPSVWTRLELRECFENGKWKQKKLFGDRRAIRKPCIRVLNYGYQFKGALYAYQAAWNLKKGPVPPNKVIVHDCTMTKKNKKHISSCINVRHMRLKPIQFNLSARECEKKLVDYWKRNKTTKSFRGPLFVEDLPGDHTCPHGDARGNGRCYLNCKEIDEKVHGVLLWY